MRLTLKENSLSFRFEWCEWILTSTRASQEKDRSCGTDMVLNRCQQYQYNLQPICPSESAVIIFHYCVFMLPSCSVWFDAECH